MCICLFSCALPAVEWRLLVEEFFPHIATKKLKTGKNNFFLVLSEFTPFVPSPVFLEGPSFDYNDIPPPPPSLYPPLPPLNFF